MKKITKAQQHKKDRRTAKRSLKQADLSWREQVVTRDNLTCQMCLKPLPKPSCQAHHIIPRQFKEFRHELWNGITLCFRCHKVGPNAAHQNAIAFNLWLLENRSLQYLKVYEVLKIHRNI